MRIVTIGIRAHDHGANESGHQEGHHGSVCMADAVVHETVQT